MNIYFLHQRYTLPNQPWSTRSYFISEELIRRGHEVIVITGSAFNDGAEDFGYSRTRSKYGIIYFSHTKHADVITIPDLFNLRSSVLIRLLRYAIYPIVSIIVILLSTRCDLLVVSSGPLPIVIPAILFSRCCNLPYVLEVRDIWPESAIQLGFVKNKFLIKLFEWLEVTGYKRSKVIIGLSKGICGKILRKSKRPVAFIPNGVDDIFFENVFDNKSKKDSSEVRVVYAGSCRFNNAINVLFEVARQFEKDQQLSDNVKFILVGDGPALRSELYNSTPPSNIVLYGERPKSEVSRILKACDIALFSQRKASFGDMKMDGLGNKFFDFLGACLPIVAGVVDGGEQRKYIESSRCGIVVEPGDVSALCKAVKRLVLDVQLRSEMSNAANRLRFQFRRKDQVSLFADILEKIELRNSR